ncbi:MAG: thioredoxin family protein [Betaproteobacteria bacterium]|nr:thioredoxin family protein [Betaproteobacteria bacterium]
MKRRETLLAVGGVLAGMSVPDLPAMASAAQEKTAPPFAVEDATGKRRTLEEFKGKIVVLEWTSPSCPFVRAQYASGKMQELQGWAKVQGVIWLSVLSTHPARGDYLPPVKAAAYNLERKAQPTALLMDASGQMGHAYGARNTPHMFVINGAGQIAYAGAIDTQPTVDESVVQKSKNLVRAALSDLLAGRKVTVPMTTPYGCLVGYSV